MLSERPKWLDGSYGSPWLSLRGEGRVWTRGAAYLALRFLVEENQADGATKAVNCESKVVCEDSPLRETANSVLPGRGRRWREAIPPWLTLAHPRSAVGHPPKLPAP